MLLTNPPTPINSCTRFTTRRPMPFFRKERVAKVFVPRSNGAAVTLGEMQFDHKRVVSRAELDGGSYLSADIQWFATTDEMGLQHYI